MTAIVIATVAALTVQQAQGQQDPVALTVDTALRHVGEVAQVCGTLDEVAYRPSMPGSPTFLIFRSATESTFAAVIAGDDRANFILPPEEMYERDARICMEGAIGEIVPGRITGMMVVSPEAIEVTEFTAPRRTHFVAPEYPAAALRQRIEGLVVLQAIIDRNGNVIDPVIVTPLPHEALNRAALRAVREWRFEPATRDGEPMQVVLTLNVTFAIVRTGASAE